MIYLGADHGGYNLKEELKKHLTRLSLPYSDLGTHTVDPADDYPDYAFAVAEKVRDGGPDDYGILISTNSIGTCIAANKIKGARAAVGYSAEAVKHARSDVDSNILCVSGEEMKSSDLIKLVDTFIRTLFTHDERHVRRLSKIQRREQEE